MCMTFVCNPQINFVIFFAVRTKSFLSLKHLDTGYLVQICLKLCRCFCQGLKMCMTLGCNP